MRPAALDGKKFYRLSRAVIESWYSSSVPQDKDKVRTMPVGAFTFLCGGGGEGNSAVLKKPFVEGTQDEGKRPSKNDDDDGDLELDDDDEEPEDLIEPDDDTDARPIFVNKTLHLVLSEKSLAARRKFTRCQVLSIKQILKACIFSCFNMKLPERSRQAEGFEGSNIGDAIEQVDIPDIENDMNLWRLEWHDKRDCYGSANLPKTQQLQADKDSMHGTKEPFCFWSWPLMLMVCVLKSYFVENCIDMTPAEGTLAWACLICGIPYVGVCMTETHRDMLEKRLQELYKKHMADGNHLYQAIYNIRFATQLAAAASSNGIQTTIGDANPKATVSIPKTTSPPPCANAPVNLIVEESVGGTADDNAEQGVPSNKRPRPKPAGKPKPAGTPKPAGKPRSKKAKNGGDGDHPNNEEPGDDDDDDEDNDDVWDPLASGLDDDA